MLCYCCGAEIKQARKVRLHAYQEISEPPRDPNSAAYLSYREDMTFRWAFICTDCYELLDNECGVAQIGARAFNLAGGSRGGKAAIVDRAKYQAFQRKLAEEMGLG